MFNQKFDVMSLIKSNDANWLPSVLDDMLKTDWLGENSSRGTIGTRIPAVNIQETEENFMLALAAPGKTKKDFNIELDNNVLTISSEEREEKTSSDANGRFTRKEFNYNNFKRAFSLPETVESDKISAAYKNGVLEINLPKKEEAKQQAKRMIEIG
jgi:HSP20 family protein